MPNDTTQPPPNQAPTPGDKNHAQNPEEMLITYLKELEQQIADLSMRVDVLENGSNPQPNAPIH